MHTDKEDLSKEFISAFKFGKWDEAESLLNKGVDINTHFNSNGETALRYAAFHKQESAIKFLISHKNISRLQINKQDELEQTALHVAAYGAYNEIINILLNANASADIIDVYDDLPIHTYLKNGKLKDPNTFKRLVSKTSNINQATGPHSNYDFAFVTALYMACLMPNRIELIKAIFIRNDVDPNVENLNGFTPLHTCVYLNDIEAVRLLIEHNYGSNINIDLNAVTDEQPENGTAHERVGHTPLHYAALKCNLDMIKLLIEKGADDTITLSKKSDGKKTVKEIFLQNFKDSEKGIKGCEYDEVVSVAKKAYLDKKSVLQALVNDGKLIASIHLSVANIDTPASKPAIVISEDILKNKVVNPQVYERTEISKRHVV